MSIGIIDPNVLVETILIQRVKKPLRIIKAALSIRLEQTYENKAIVHYTEVIGLVIGVFKAAMMQSQVMTELMHESAGLVLI